MWLKASSSQPLRNHKCEIHHPTCPAFAIHASSGYHQGWRGGSENRGVGRTMSDVQREYRFVLGSLAPETLPMARLATYLDHLARILGETEHVHFERLESGSGAVIYSVDAEAVERVEGRIQSIASGDIPKDAIRPLDALKDCLATDDATGSLLTSNGERILHLASSASVHGEVLAVTDSRTLDGVLIRIGGKGTTVPVHLQAGEEIHQCEASRETARKMAPHIYGKPLRVSGDGTWQSVALGNWQLIRFRIADFRELGDGSLMEDFERLREIGFEGWKQFDDPMEEIMRMRGYEDSE